MIVAQLDEGNVLGGRYLITGQVLATAEQDVILTGLDQVLNREVMILVASPDHASQVATSARQLATGERASDVQVLDLGLSDNRTYLISAGETDPQSLLSLVTGHDVYVEPFYTENLGSEIFGESRSYEPETYDDDDEYYSSLDSDVAASSEHEAHRPKFLNRISDRLNDSLNRTDDPSKLIRPGETHPTQQPSQQSSRPAHGTGAGAAANSLGATGPGTDTDDDQSNYEPETDQAPRHAEDQAEEAGDRAVSEPVATTGPIPVVNGSEQTPDQTPGQPPEQPAGEAPTSEAAAASVEASEVPTANDPAPQNVQERVAQAMGNSAAAGGSVSAPDPAPGGYGQGYAVEYTDERQGGGAGRWIGAVLLVAILVAAVVVMFTFLGRGDTEPVAEPTQTAEPEDQADQEPQEGESPQDDAAPVGADPVITGISRVVPDSPNLSSQTDDQLPLAVDGDPATSWRSLSFAQSQFGGFARNMALVIELEEESEISEVNITQNGGSGGSFTVLVSDTANPADGTSVAEGSFTGPTYTASVSGQDGDPVTAQYVIINFTDLPLAADASEDLPYAVNIAEITVD
ncbi:hypothetical protein DCC26_01675 [Auritidibacter sp. NML120779]|nr:hypothetical protein DCC26_01675 [Auritidibacter sp. NML120779]